MKQAAGYTWVKKYTAACVWVLKQACACAWVMRQAGGYTWVMKYAIVYAWVGKLAGQGWGRGGAAGWAGVMEQASVCKCMRKFQLAVQG